MSTTKISGLAQIAFVVLLLLCRVTGSGARAGCPAKMGKRSCSSDVALEDAKVSKKCAPATLDAERKIEVAMREMVAARGRGKTC